MIKQIKDTARAGVTLVELLVVILIVAILAVSLLPMFQKYVIKAQYASEAIPLVGHIRTQIGLYQYENGKLPVPATVSDSVYIIKKGTGNIPYDVINAGNDRTGSTSVAGDDSFMQNMDLSFSDMMGRRVSPYNVEYAVATNGDSYGYAIGVFGGNRAGGETKLPGNSGYAMAEYYFDGISLGTTNTMSQGGYKFVAEWEKYDSGTSGIGFKFDAPGADQLEVLAIPSMDQAQESGGKLNSAFMGYFTGNVIGKWKYQTPPAEIQQ